MQLPAHKRVVIIIIIITDDVPDHLRGVNILECGCV